MKYKLDEIFDIEKLGNICKSFTELTGAVTAILDLEGNVHVSTGWQPICTQFHRVNKETSKLCTESDTVLASQLQEGHNYSVYKCKNGLTDVAMPIMVKDTHIGNLFTGQFLTEKADIDFFKEQAKRCKFNEKEYLEALSEVPIYSDEKIRKIVQFLVQLTETIGNIGLKSLESIDATVKLEAEKTNISQTNNNLKIAQIALSKSQEQLESYITNAPDGIFVANEKGEYLEVNKAACTITGYSEAELLELSIAQLIQPEYLKEAKNHFEKVKEEGFASDEIGYLTKSGQKMVWLIDAVKISDTRFLGFAKDITGRKASEEELRKSKESLEMALIGAGAGLWSWNVKTGKDILDERCYQIFGYTKEELDQEKSIWELLIHPDDRDKIFEGVKKHLEDESCEYRDEYRMKCKNGNWKWVHILGKLVERDSEGKPLIMTGIIIDIDKRKRSDLASQKKEQQYKLLIKNSPDLLISQNVEGEVTYVSPQSEEILGYVAEDVKSLVISEQIHPDDVDFALQRMYSALKGEILENLEYRYLKKNGDFVWLSHTARPIFTDGKVSEVQSTVRDITKSKLAEEKILQSQYHLAKAQEIGKTGSWRLNAITTELKWSDETYSIFGLPVGSEMTHDLFLKSVHPDDRVYLTEKFEAAINNQKLFDINHRILVNNKIKWVREKAFFKFDTDGTPVSADGFVQDITDRKLAELALIESEKKRNLWINSSPVSTKIVDLDFNLQFMSVSGVNALGLGDITKYYGKPYPLIFYSESFKNPMIENLKRVKKNGKTISHEAPIAGANGNELWYQSTIVPVNNDKGEIDYFLIVSTDITERKNAELELLRVTDRIEESNDRFSMAMQVTTDGLWDWDLITNDIYFSSRWKAILGYEDHELPNDFSVWETLTKDEDVKHSWQILNELIEGKCHKFELEIQMKHKDGHWLDVLSRANVFFNDENIAYRVVGTHTDISERKRSEKKLSQSEDRFRKLIENMPDGVAIYKPVRNGEDFKFIDINIEAENITKSSKRELVGHTLLEKFPNMKSSPLFESLQKVHKTGEALYLPPFYYKDEQRDGWRKNHIYKLQTGEIVAIFTDVTGLKEGEESLKNINRELVKAEELLNETGKLAKVGGWEIDFLGNTLAWTDETFHIHELPLSEQPNVEEAIKFYHPDDRSMVAEVINEATSKKQAFDFEARLVTSKGNTVWVRSSGKVIKNKDVAVGLRGSIQDITVRKQRGDILRKSEEMLINSQSLANICSYSTNLVVRDIDKSQWECSPEFYNLFGIDKNYPHTIKGWTGFIHPEYKDEMIDYHESVVKEKSTFNKEYKIIRINDGVERWVHGTGELEFDKKGTPIRMYGAIQDITERKEVELALIKREKQLRMITNNFLDCMIYQVIAPEVEKRGFSYISSSVIDLYGCTPEEGIENPSLLYERIHPDDVKGFATAEAESQQKMTPFRKQCRVYNPDGSIRWSYFVSHPRKMDNTIFWDGIEVDITKQKQIEDELVKAKEKAEESDRLKSAFLANMSHEIRTPMNGILGFTTLLKTPDLSGEKRDRFIDIIRKSGDRMLCTVNDIIDISKIDAGQVEIVRSDVNINDEIETLFEFFESEATAKGLEFRLNNSLPRESIIISDKVKVESIISNLIKNAIKYTDKGRIEISCSKNNTNLEFKITDTGIGISKKRIHSIFNRFEQADIEDTRAYEGSGLGLAISKAYVEMLEGRISVSSRLDKGTVFDFTIPWVQQQKKSKEINEEEVKKIIVGKKVNILIAEDDNFSFQFLEVILKPVTNSIVRVVNGKEAVDFMKDAADIDLILMDVKMPVMDGYQATQEIRKENKHVAIIAQTANALEGDYKKALAVGCNDYIAKPINTEALYALINKHINK